MTVAIGSNSQGAPRSTEAQRTLRAAEVLRLLMNGYSRRDVLEHAAAEWQISIRATDRLIHDARKAIREDWSIERSEALAQMLSQVATLQQRAMEAGQLGLALACINSTAKLIGLFK